MKGPPTTEAGRLREENAALDDQVKLLVQTEQRLYRTRNELDRQIARLQGLADFALQYSSLEPPAGILDRAVQLVLATFHVNRVASVRVDDRDPRHWLVSWQPGGAEGAAAVEVPPSVLAWVQGLESTALLSMEDEAARHRVGALMRALTPPGGEVPPCVDAGVLVMCTPLRVAEGRLFGFIIACRSARYPDSHYKEQLTGTHLPFFQLLANHLERALQNAMLTTDLRERGRELADANRRLTASVENLERAQQQLVQAQKMEAIGRLAGGIAHDFNNLLTVVLSRAELLKQGHPDESNEGRGLSQIVNAAERAARITGQLLAFSRKQRHRPEDIDLNSLAMEIGQVLGGLIGEQVSLDLRLDPSLGRIHADRTQVEQIILNLVVNARDAMDEGGVVTIETRRARGEDIEDAPDLDVTRYVALSVSDTGRGMDDAMRRQVFEPFFSTKEMGRGTGLGLATVYGLVKQNEGHIGVSSVSGLGSCFTALFPAATGHDPSRGETGDETEARSRATVLLAEDEDGIRSIASQVLRRKGYEVIEARDGEEALDKANRSESAVDLLVTDVVMPRMGGVALVAALRKTNPDLTVVFMSGYTFDSLEGSDARRETDRFLPKPFTPDVLLETVRKALRC